MALPISDSDVEQPDDDWGIIKAPFDPQDTWSDPERLWKASDPQVPEGWNWADEQVKKILNQGPDRAVWIRGDCLGSGGFSRVFKVMKKRQQLLFAGKSSKVGIDRLKREAEILQSLDHEHLLKHKGWYEERGNPENTLLLTELCMHGTLQDYVLNAAVLRRSDVCRVVQQVGSALNWLHNRKMYHSDIKPHNIFIRSLTPLDMVLGDCSDIKQVTANKRFKHGARQSHEPSGPRFTGTRMFMSPQVAQADRHHGKEDDIWALGVTMVGMMGQLPPHRKQYVQYPRRVQEHARLLQSSSTNNQLGNLMVDMLSWESKDRPSAAACCKQASVILEECPPVAEDVPATDMHYRQERWLTLGFDEQAIPEDFEPISRWGR